MPAEHRSDVSGTAVLARWTAFAFAFAVGINIGGALLATVVIFPVWSHSQAAAMAWEGRVDEASFFVVVAPIAMLLAVASFAASWRASPAARRWMRIAPLFYAAFFIITITYFVPEQLAMKGEAGARLPSMELAGRLERWVILNWVRQVFGVTVFLAALHALGLTYCGVMRRTLVVSDAAESP
jgi:hypothetical protein